MTKQKGIAVDRGGLSGARQTFSQLANDRRAQTHFNASIRNSVRLSSGKSADKARELNALVGEVVKEQALMNARTLTLVQNIENGFTRLDSDLANSIRESV